MKDIPDYTPIFITGCSRSGTTLLGSMLGNHPKSICTPESQFIKKLLPEKYNSETPSITPKKIKQAVNHFRFKLWKTEPPPSILEKAKNYNPCDVINQLVNAYQNKVGISNASYWIDHTPSHHQFFSTLRRFYPDACFIHLVRDPRAVARSFFNFDWSQKTALSAAEYWDLRVNKYADIVEANPEVYLEIRYEDLVSNPGNTIKEICDFADFEFHSKMLKGGGFIPPDYTIQHHKLVGQKPDPSRLDLWEDELSKKQIRIIETVTKVTMERFGYKLKYPDEPYPVGFWFRLGNEIVDFYYRYLINPTKYIWRRKKHPDVLKE